MIVLDKESTVRRGLLVQFHEEDLVELRTALHALRALYRDRRKRDWAEERVPEWVGRLEGAIVERLAENQDFPGSRP